MTWVARLLLAVVVCVAPAVPLLAAQSEAVTAPAVTARLITAENTITPGSGTASAGIQLVLEDGWKTYWRSPGEVGLPPEIDWTGSENVAAAELAFPAPTRFVAFEIENYGYGEAVTFPIRVQLAEAGAPAALRARVNILVCADICIPQELELALDLPAGPASLDTDAATEIAAWSARVPEDGVGTVSAAFAADALVITASRPGRWAEPSVFPEASGASFGPPELRLSQDGQTLWARLPVVAGTLERIDLTLTDGPFATTHRGVALGDAPPLPPDSPGLSRLLGLLATAFLGGLILNVMPCVLPVLSIKLASALGHGGRSPAQVRRGFLATAAGTVAFMWVLAGLVLVLQTLGYAVGWGTQFQSPLFLVALVLVLSLFAANLFGVFEIALPQGMATRLSSVGSATYAGDFATGALAAVLATPCSAPFIGTAVAFALTGTPVMLLAIFTVMGLGLATPYLIVAARPRLVRLLPKPGRWMLWVKALLGVLLLGTAVWLLSVLAAVTSLRTMLLVGVLCALVAVSLWLAARGALAAPRGVVAALIVATLAAPAILPQRGTASAAEASTWRSFDTDAIAVAVAEGRTVFVDITADWCLTCKANKALVLDRNPVRARLADPGIVAVRGDWTRPDPAISAYLERHGRYGIPFNAVYGPGAPDGMPLGELLGTDAVLAALDAAARAP